MAGVRGSVFVPVRLTVNHEEHLNRIKDQTRRKRHKTINPRFVYEGRSLLHFTHPNFFEIEVSNLRPEKTAGRIIEHLDKLR